MGKVNWNGHRIRYSEGLGWRSEGERMISLSLEMISLKRKRMALWRSHGMRFSLTIRPLKTGIPNRLFLQRMFPFQENALSKCPSHRKLRIGLSRSEEHTSEL